MDETIENYKNLIIELGKRHRKCIMDRMQVIEIQQGPYNLEISQCEEGIIKAEKRIRELKEIELSNAHPVESQSVNMINVFVISGSVQRVRNALGEYHFGLLEAPLHDAFPADWYPFSKDCEKIAVFLDDIQSTGRNFQIEYIEGVIDIHTLNRMTNDSNYNLIIIDLMSMDIENIEIVRYLDRSSGNNLYTPVCTFLANDLKVFLFDLRSRIFRVLENNRFSAPAFFFDITTNDSFETAIIRSLDKINPIQFQLLNRPMQLPRINPGF